MKWQWQQKFPFRDGGSYLLSFWTYSWSSFWPVPGTSYAMLTITLFLSYFEYSFLSTEKKLTTHLTSVMRSQRKTDKSVPIWKLYLDNGHMHVQYTYNAAKTELWMHDSFDLQKREDLATRVRTFPTCPLAAGGWNRRTWRPTCAETPGAQLHPIPSELNNNHDH